MNKPLILVVEDDGTVRNLITTTLKSNDYRYLTAADAQSAIAAASTQQPGAWNTLWFQEPKRFV